MGNDRIRFALAGGRVQAVYSPTVAPGPAGRALPDELADLAPLLALTLGEHQDASMSGLVKLLERSLSDPRRLRALLRFQSAVLTYWGMTGEPGKFAFEPITALPPMFQALPAPDRAWRPWSSRGHAGAGPCSTSRNGAGSSSPARPSRGGNADRAGLSNAEIKVHTLLDGAHALADIARQAGIEPATTSVVTVRGLELAGLVERRTPVVVRVDPRPGRRPRDRPR